MLALLINLVMLCSTFAVLIATRGARGDRRAKPQSTDILLVLTLIAAGVIVGMWSGRRLFANVSMLVLMAYSVGHWRGLKQSQVDSSDSPSEI
jgi:hypothetical protein